MAVAGIALGIILLYRSGASFYTDGANGRATMNLLLALVCAYGSGISRAIYIADAGVVREMRSWGRVTRRIARWDEVKHISISFRGQHMMAFFEIDVRGWKILFKKNQYDELMDILDELLPGGIDVNLLDKL